MKTAIEKFRLIFRPFLLIAVGFVLLYTFLVWLLLYHVELFRLKEDVYKFWLPFALPWIPVLIWLRPRIRLLQLMRKGNDNLYFFYQFVAVGAIAATTIAAQSYLSTANGKLQTLASINQINQQKKTKYYTVANVYAYKAMAGQHAAAEVSGKYNADLTFHLYRVVPLFASARDTASGECEAWLGIAHKKTVSNRLSQEEKQRQYEVFVRESAAAFSTLDLNKPSTFEQIGHTDEADGFAAAIPTSVAVARGGHVILKPLDGSYADRNGNKLPWTFGAFVIGATVFLVMLLIPPFNKAERSRFLSGEKRNDNDSFKEVLALVRPHEGYRATPVLLLSILAVWLAMVIAGLGFFSFIGRDLFSWGANFRPAVQEGHWWRLVTSVFLHGGLLHLFSNAVGLLFIGLFLEPKIGTARFALLYLFTGLMGSLASLWWHPATVSVGASGAIFGMQGVFLALMLRKRFPPAFSKVFLVATLTFIGYNLLMGLYGGIDNAAHVGGLVSGFSAGLLVSSFLPKEEDPKPVADKRQNVDAEQPMAV